MGDGCQERSNKDQPEHCPRNMRLFRVCLPQNHATFSAICASRRLIRHLTEMCVKKRVLFTCGHTQEEMVKSCGHSDCTVIFRLERAGLVCQNCGGGS